MRTTKVVAVALLALLVATVTTTTITSAAEAAPDEPGTYIVEYTNITEAQWLTPPNYAAHDESVSIFKRGTAASAGVQAVAENGGVGVLAEELLGAVDGAGLGISGVGAAAPIAPGDTVSFEFTTSQTRFSALSMIICTNDGFTGIQSRVLPKVDGRSRTFYAEAYDAGTERNTERRRDLVPAPFCGEGPGSGESNPAIAEDRVVRHHPTLQGIGDLDPALDWEGPVAMVTITRVNEPIDYTVTVENLTDGQYLTPPNFAAHNAAVDVFERGEAASPGVQAVAENGGVGVLAAELNAAVDAAGLGVSGVGAAAPIAPGETISFEVSSTERRLSIVSMIICTNDGFAGLDSRGLPRYDGDTRTFYMRGLDAGTEVNTEMRADLVPAPFCGEGPGSGESNPELAEEGVITRHPTQRGLGDLDPALDWTGAVAKVTVTRNG